MKRYMMALMIAAVAAGTAYAQEGNDEQEGHGGKAWSHGNGDQQGWSQRDERGDQNRGGDRQEWNKDQRGGNEDRARGDKQAWGQDKRGGNEDRGGFMDPAMMEQMKADHKAIRELGEAARAETDEAKKAELVKQLTAKIGEVADRMQANQEKRIAQAEERLAGLKAKIEDAKKNRDTMIDEQVKRILSGEKFQRPAEGFRGFPNAKGGQPEGEPAGSTPPPPPAGDDKAPAPAE